MTGPLADPSMVVTVAMNQLHMLLDALADDHEITRMSVWFGTSITEDTPPGHVAVWLNDDGMQRYEAIKPLLPPPRSTEQELADHHMDGWAVGNLRWHLADVHQLTVGQERDLQTLNDLHDLAHSDTA